MISRVSALVAVPGGDDLDYGDLSPGRVLLGHLLQWGNDCGRGEFDFLI